MAVDKKFEILCGVFIEGEAVKLRTDLQNSCVWPSDRNLFIPRGTVGHISNDYGSNTEVPQYTVRFDIEGESISIRKVPEYLLEQV